MYQYALVVLKCNAGCLQIYEDLTFMPQHDNSRKLGKDIVPPTQDGISISGQKNSSEQRLHVHWCHISCLEMPKQPFVLWEYTCIQKLKDTFVSYESFCLLFLLLLFGEGGKSLYKGIEPGEVLKRSFQLLLILSQKDHHASCLAHAQDCSISPTGCPWHTTVQHTGDALLKP